MRNLIRLLKRINYGVIFNVLTYILILISYTSLAYTPTTTKFEGFAGACLALLALNSLED